MNSSQPIKERWHATIILGAVHSPRQFTLIEGVYFNPITDDKVEAWWSSVWEKYPGHTKMRLSSFERRLSPRKALELFIKLMENHYSETNMRQFTAKYMEIFNLKPDAGIITELI